MAAVPLTPVFQRRSIHAAATPYSRIMAVLEGSRLGAAAKTPALTPLSSSSSTPTRAPSLLCSRGRMSVRESFSAKS
jgi:hypothetical protein